MRMRTNVWLIIAACLVLIGCMIWGGAMSMLNWDFTKLSTVKYECNTYEVSENYKDISIVTDTADIVFIPSKSMTTSVSCYEQENNVHSVSVANGTLEIKVVDTRKWYEYIGTNFKTPKITILIPEGEYGNLTVKASTSNIEIPEVFTFKSVDILTSTGHIINHASTLENAKIETITGNVCIEDTSAGSLNIAVSTGKVTVSGVTCEGDIAVSMSTGKASLSNIHCKNFSSNGNTGDISLHNVIAMEKLSIKSSTGNITLDRFDASEIYIESETGNVTGSVLTDKVFIVQTNTGKPDVPKTVNGGKCEITTNTGNIKISIAA